MGNLFEKKEKQHLVFTPPPPPREVLKISEMLRQVQIWINQGETEIAEKHWDLISEECKRYGTGKKA
jgi:hypothetical protein